MSGRPSDQWLSPENLETTVAIGAGTNFIGLSTVVQANQPALVAGTAQIGSVTVSNPISFLGNVTLNPSSSFIGLVTAVQASPVTLGASANYIGLATVVNTDPLLRAGEDQTNDVMKVEQQFSSTTLTSATTVAVKAAAGFIHLFNVGMPSCPTIIFYDNTVPSGTVLHRIAAGYPMGSHPLDVKFTTGLSLDAIGSGGGVVPSIMVAWR